MKEKSILSNFLRGLISVMREQVYLSEEQKEHLEDTFRIYFNTVNGTIYYLENTSEIQNEGDKTK